MAHTEIVPKAKVMIIKTRKSPGGVYFATSEDEPTLFVSTVSRESLDEAVRGALEELYSDLHHKIVAALPVDVKGNERRWAIVPREAVEARVEARTDC